MIKDIPEPHKFIINKKEVIIERKYKDIKILYCALCEDNPYKHPLDYNDGKFSTWKMREHLIIFHDITFDNPNKIKKLENKQTKVQNTLKCLSYFKEKISKEIVWICPVCKKELFWHKSLLNAREPYRHIKKHVQQCKG